MKKTLFCLALALCLCLTGCKSAPSANQPTASTPANPAASNPAASAPVEKEIPALYEAVLARYTDAMAEYWDMVICMDSDVNYMLSQHEGDPFTDIGYIITDLDGDGVDELLIAATPTTQVPNYQCLVYDLFTIKDDACVRVFGSVETNLLFYLGDGKFANVGFNDWNDALDDILQFRDFSLTKVGEGADPADYVQLPLTPFKVRY